MPEHIEPSSWQPNGFGRQVDRSERRLVQELVASLELAMEERRAAYLFRSRRWGDQVLRVSARVFYRTPEPVVRRVIERFAASLPLSGEYAGVHLKGLNGSAPIAFRLRAEHREALEK